VKIEEEESKPVVQLTQELELQDLSDLDIFSPLVNVSSGISSYIEEPFVPIDFQEEVY
jgi:hypothetical protein